LDPDAAREEIESILRREPHTEDDQERLAELREALEEWKRKGGF
jgi:hypothetical protein